jgi:two-component system response regulator FixJ
MLDCDWSSDVCFPILQTQARRADIRARIARLSARERQVYDRVVMGIPNRDMAVEFGLSPRTIEVFRSRMMEKMQARSVPELVRMALDAEKGAAGAPG